MVDRRSQPRSDFAASDKAREIARLIATGKMETFPASLVKRLDAGEHAVRVFRELRELARAQLAFALDVETAWVHEVEEGKRRPTEQEWQRLATVLRVDADLLQP